MKKIFSRNSSWTQFLFKMPRFSKSHKLETLLSSKTSSCDTTDTGSLSIVSTCVALKVTLHNLCPGTFPAGPDNTQPSTVDTATGESPVSPHLTSQTRISICYQTLPKSQCQPGNPINNHLPIKGLLSVYNSVMPIAMTVLELMRL